jgi:4-hydroxy-tetrahydrodipicolinate synthase
MGNAAKPLRGIVPPLVTPLADRETLDPAGLQRLVEHVLAGGVSGLFLLGTTGEGPSLSHAVREEVVRRVARQVAGRVPVVVGVTDTSMAESLRLAEVAAEADALAVVLAPPPYFPVRQDDLRRYVERMAEESPLPLVLYNMPSHSKLVFEPETVRALVEIPRIVGLKDSSGELGYFRRVGEVVSQRDDFSLLMGPEELLAEAVALGADGGVCGGANLRPRLYVDLFRAAARAEGRRVGKLHAEVLRTAAAFYRCDQGSAGVIKGLKCALSHLGICRDVVAEPLQPLEPRQQEGIRGKLTELGLSPVSAGPRRGRRPAKSALTAIRETPSLAAGSSTRSVRPRRP